MSDGAIARIQPAAIQAFTGDQRDLIRRTVAPGATDDELAMFLHVAQRSGLDPLRKQIHFTKMGGRIAFIADVNGLQARAAKEPDFEGLLHAVVYEKDAFEMDNAAGVVAKHTNNPLGSNGKIIGAWATVHRKGMRPFTAVVKFSEYENSSNALWKSKPAVMIDKVAKSTALRLAYPEQLGGIYEAAEMEEREVNAAPTPTVSRTSRIAAEVAAQVAAPPAEPPKALSASTAEYERVLARMNEAGVALKEWTPKLRELTGKTKRADVTKEDADKVLAFFFPEPPPDNTPPPESSDGIPHS